MRSTKPRILLTLGDPSGIGPEVVLKSLAEKSVRRLAQFCVVGNRIALEEIGRRIRLGLPKGVSLLETATLRRPFRFGRIHLQNGKASLAYLQKAVTMLRKDEADLLVTAPLHKESLRLTGVPWEGHTEMLRDLTASPWVEMAFIGQRLRLILATRHLPLQKVSQNLNRARLLQVLRRMDAMLRFYFGLERPRLALCGLNPHAGEGGLFGKEEERILKPAVRTARRRGVRVEGPLAPDGLFYQAYHGAFDGVVALYHDQGLIPFKMVERDAGVNVTLGLPFIRTSPDHGTAFDIAGRGIADPRSMMHAIEVACHMWRKSRGRTFPSLS